VKTTMFVLLSLLAGNALAGQETYGIDSTHSFANWSIRHVVSKTSGTFPDIKGKIIIDRTDLSKSSVEARINVFSVNSNHAKRDDHIKKEEYLDAGKFGEMRFASTSVEAFDQSEGILHGKLTLHGVTREISFPFKVLGFGPDPWGGNRMGVEAHTGIKASDYGFPWALKPGAPVGDDIEITLLIEGVQNNLDYKPW
jgi:polyisoprenoid-binding protein YceI